MKLFIRFVWISIFSLYSFIAFADSEPEMQKYFKSISEKFGQSVFAVNAYKKIQSSNNEDQAKNDKWNQNVGTALMLDDLGHLITFKCVLGGANEIKLTSSDGKKFKASSLINNTSMKIAVIKINGSFDPVSINSCGNEIIKPGMDILIFGVAKGDSFCVKSGTVSPKIPPDGAIIVDVNGNPGTSGSLVLDKNLNVLGLLAFQIEQTPDNSLKSCDSFVVIPIEHVLGMAHNIISSAEKNYGWLGISTVITKTPLQRNGVVVHKIFKNSPAEKCGMKINDYIIEFNGITVDSPMELIEAIRLTKAGDSVRLKINRDKKSFLLTTVLDPMPDFNEQ